MNPVKVNASNTWISFISIVEEGPQSRYSQYQRMLTRHLRFPFIKYGLLEREHTLALLAQVPRDNPDQNRLNDIEEAFKLGWSWYQS